MAAFHPGPGLDPASTLGPLIGDRQRNEVVGLVDDAVGKGAQLLLGGEVPPGKGYFYPPTVLRGVPHEAELRTEEIFGPVAAIYPFDTGRKAIAAANDTPFGLASYVFSRDLSQEMRIAEALDSGMTGINRGVISNPAAPFGGIKEPGLGREGGSHGIEEYLETTYIGLAI